MPLDVLFKQLLLLLSQDPSPKVSIIALGCFRLTNFYPVMVRPAGHLETEQFCLWHLLSLAWDGSLYLH
jgi:hypothetical protein